MLLLGLRLPLCSALADGMPLSAKIEVRVTSHIDGEYCRGLHATEPIEVRSSLFWLRSRLVRSHCSIPSPLSP